MARHNELRDGLADLAGKAFTPFHVRDDPLIYSGHAARRPKPTPDGSTKPNPTSEASAVQEVTDQKGDLLIRDLWQQGTDSVHDMRVMNTDALMYLKKAPEKCLHEAEKGNRRMYLEACLQQRQHFSHFVSLVEGMLGVEATATLKRIASCLTTKWRQPYSKTCGYVKSRVEITLVRVTHRSLHVSQVPAHQISVQRPQWEDEAGLNLFWYGPQITKPQFSSSSPLQHKQTNTKTPPRHPNPRKELANRKKNYRKGRQNAGGQ